MSDADDVSTLADVVRVSRLELVAALEPAAASSIDPAPSPPTRRALGHQLADEVDVLLRRDLVSICTLGWRASDALHEAGLDTMRRPGETELVELAEQTMSCPQTVSFDLIVAEQRLGTVAITVGCDVSLVDLAVTVADGAITGVEFGTCTVAVSIRDAADDVLLDRSHTFTEARQLGLPSRLALIMAATREASASE